MKRILFTFLFLFMTAASATASVVPYPTEITADSPLVYYRFSETSGGSVSDSSGNAKTLTLSGTYTRNISELLFNVLAADKALTATSATATSSAISTTAGFTFSALLKFSSLSGTQHLFEAGSFGDNANGWHDVYYLNGELRFDYQPSNGSFQRHHLGFTPVAGDVYHLVVTNDYATGATKFYVNGKLLNTETGLPAAPLLARTPTYFNGFTGTIDEVAVFSAALSAARIKAQFAASRGIDAAQMTYYASPNGSIYSRGTSSDPMDFQTAVNSALFEAGKTVIAQNGIYRRGNLRPDSDKSIFVVGNSGTSGNRIVVKCGASRCTLDGEGWEGNVVSLNGSFIDLVNFEIRKTWSVRTSNIANTQGSPITGTNGTLTGAGVTDTGSNNRTLHNVIHDVIGDCLVSFSNAANGEYYGNLCYNNGWDAPRTQEDVDAGVKQPNGHGIYTQNDAANSSTKKIKYNIFFNAYSSPIKAAGSGTSQVENYEIEGNLSVRGGFAYDIGGGNDGANNVNLNKERTFHSVVYLGYNTNAGRVASITNSYIYGGFNILDFNSATFTGNTVIGEGTAFTGLAAFAMKTAYSNSTINNNVYYHNAANFATQFGSSQTGLANGTGSNFTDYKALTGWDAASTYYQGSGYQYQTPAANKVFVEPVNAYESNRGYVAIYNWENANTQTVNLSTILSNNQRYEIRSASNYYAGAVVTGTFDSASPSIVLPLKTTSGLPSVAQPYGDAGRMTETAPNFAAFVVVPLPSITVHYYGASAPPTN